MNLARSLWAGLCHARDEEREAQRGAVTWPRPHARSSVKPEACSYLALQSLVGLAFDSEALTVACLQSSGTHLASHRASALFWPSGLDLQTTVPLALAWRTTLPPLITPLLGPGVFLTEHRARRGGQGHLPGETILMAMQ